MCYSINLLSFAIAFALTTIGESSDPIVTISNGQIRGLSDVTVDQRKVYYAYRGIPYAEPPIGPLRFEPPVAKSNWVGIWDATRDGEMCVQSGNFVNGSEDCLFINVYTPEHPGSRKVLSTMVFIYGGAFETGNSRYGTYAPDYLLEQDVVVVTFNYRVFVMGFLSTGDLVAPGNAGLKDQVLAFQWVQKNIASFGGNPNDVVIFGQSAGAASVAYHRQSLLSRGLFHKAIMESGVSLSAWAYCRQVPELVKEIATKLGVDTSSSDKLVQGLKEVDYADLHRAAVTSANKLYLVKDPSQGYAFCPVIEPVHAGAFINKPSRQMLIDGEFSAVPTIIGYNSLEGAFNAPLFTALRVMLLQWDFLPAKLVPVGLHVNGSGIAKTLIGKKIQRQYLGPQSAVISDYKIMLFLSDHLWIRPIREYVRQTFASAPTYLYRFSYQGGLWGYPHTRGVTHCEELGYIFRTAHLGSPADTLTRDRMVAMWTNFAKTGNPTPAVKQLVLNGTDWSPTNQNFTYIDIGTEIVQASFPSQKIMQFWDKLFHNFENPPYDTY